MHGKLMRTRLAAAVLLALGLPLAGTAQVLPDDGSETPAEAPADSTTEASAGNTAAEDRRAISFELGTGIEYDSNVAILELDTTTGIGDAAALFDFGIGYDAPTDGRVDLQLGYNFSDQMHEDLDEFDVRIHRGSGTLALDFDRVDIGVILQYAQAELDGTDFMTLTQTSPYLSKLFGRKLFLRFAYAFTDKQFASNASRDATADGFSSDAYVFLNGLRTYLVFGYRHDAEDAIDNQLDYAGQRLSLQLSQRLTTGAREPTFKTALRYETRDYDNTTLSIGAPRADDRFQLELSLDVPLSERAVLRLAYRHADNSSNLPSVDFAEEVYAVGVNATF